MKQKVLSINGQEVKDIELNDNVFSREVSEGSIYHAVRNELANKRVGTACTKTRAEVHGSNAKPFGQKGTGRARAGDKKSPLWVGGGVIFGPRPRDYSYNLPKKVKRLAIKSVLSLKAKENKLTVVEDFSIESGKTKDLVAVLKGLGIEKRALIVVRDEDSLIKRAAKNIPSLKVLSFDKLRVHDILYTEKLVLLESTVAKLNDFYAEK
ncbi:MAG: 50S ribosomal protein L4 [Spirochaetales bacterium]|nr:50S ribosomal protein L4 [Spirochaetales bacterium]